MTKTIPPPDPVPSGRSVPPSAPPPSAAVDPAGSWGPPAWLAPEEGGELFQRSRMPREPHWAVSWSDLMMTMFILFVVLYVYQSAHRPFSLRPGAAGEGRAAATTSAVGDDAVAGPGVLGGGGSGLVSADGSSPSMARVYDLGKMIQGRLGAEIADIDLVPDRAVRIVLTGDLFFDRGQAELKPTAREALRRVAELLGQNSYRVNVIGHTDSTPIHSDTFPTNWELSSARACGVARFLIEEMGLSGERFTVSGDSYYHPLHANDSAGHRAANRRVEIVITKETAAKPLPRGEEPTI